MQAKLILFGIGLTSAITSWAPRVADACSPNPCSTAHFVPSDGRLPANAPGVYWQPRFDFQTPADPSTVTLVDKAAPNKPIALTASPLSARSFLLVPSTPLAAGHTYVITDSSRCDYQESDVSSTFTVTAAAKFPPALAKLVGDQPERSAISLLHGAACKSDVDSVHAKISIERPANAAWYDALHFETLVDGEPWRYEPAEAYNPAPGAGVDGRGAERLVVACASTDGRTIQPGKHTVAMRATLPGTTYSEISNELTVNLSCADDSWIESNEPGKSSSESSIDGGPVEPSGCTVGSGRSAASSFALLALAGMLALRRTRRRAPSRG